MRKEDKRQGVCRKSVRFGHRRTQRSCTTPLLLERWRRSDYAAERGAGRRHASTEKQQRRLSQVRMRTIRLPLVCKRISCRCEVPGRAEDRTSVSIEKQGKECAQQSNESLQGKKYESLSFGPAALSLLGVIWPRASGSTHQLELSMHWPAILREQAKVVKESGLPTGVRTRKG